MARYRLSFTERRRARLAKKVDRIDRLESRNLIVDPINVAGLATAAIRGAVQIALIDAMVGQSAMMSAGAAGVPLSGQSARQSRGGSQLDHSQFRGLAIDPPVLSRAKTVGAAAARDAADGASSAVPAKPAGDWLTLSPTLGTDSSEGKGVSIPWQPVKSPGGGAALPPRGGSGNGMLPSTLALVRGRITPLRLPPLPTSTPAGAAGSAALLNAAASANASTNGLGAASPSGQPGAPIQNQYHAHPLGGQGPTSSGGSSPSSNPVLSPGNGSGPTQESFPYFPVYVLDNNDGVVLFPGVLQQGEVGAWVDLEAQVSGTTVSTYNWTISSGSQNVSGQSSYNLTFQWGNSEYAETNTVTLSVTDVNSHTETYTYDFYVPAGTVGSGGSSNATWPGSLAPDSELFSAPAFPSTSGYVSVDATSGALDTNINLPSYNPNVPAIALTYDSLTADPRPIILVEHQLSSSLAVPSQDSAVLSFNSGGGTTYYYNTSQLNGGDVQQIALQANADNLSTDRYSYTATVVDYRSSNTATPYSGSATVLNYSSNAFGDGWTLQGLEKITSDSARGGVILDLGEGGRSLWFTGSFGSGGGTYTDPPGEFSTLVENSGGGYTDTLTDGTQITFNSNGYETATINLNGQHTTYSYNGSNQLTSIEDPYGNLTTFSYSGGYLQTIQDPAGRLATFTHSGAELTGVTLPDSSTWGYAYDSGGRLIGVTDPRSNITTINYDSAERVTSIALPDSTTESFTNDQESGWTNSGTSSNPAPATLLAQATSTYTSPNGNTTALRPDWMGLGQTGVLVDAEGNVQMNDLNSNGLPTVTVDQLNLISQFQYNSQGNVTVEVHPDGTDAKYTYNSYSEPLTYIDENGHEYYYTYNGNGNLTVIQDPMNNLTTMTYTSTGRVKTVTDANKHVTTYQYDTQDRLTTIQFPDGTTNLYGYNAQGNVTGFTDGRGNTTTYSYDALNRETGVTDALHDITTLTYDSGGNLIKDQEPTPAGQTARTTTYAYDSMNRLTTVTDPLGYQTIYTYDGDGNLTSATDPMGRITTYIYDSMDRQTVVIDPMGNRTTTSYDADSNPIQTVDPMGRITTATYNNRGWEATGVDPLSATTTYSWTGTGQTSAITIPAPSGGDLYKYSYNADDEILSATDPDGDTTTYGYDGVGNETSVTDANGNTTSYAYDPMNRMTTITDALGHTTVYGYDQSGNLQTVTDALGHTTTTLYDPLDRATTIISPLGGITTIAYDAAGRETSLTDPDENTTQWAYDADDRVTTVTEPNGSTVTYVYDKDGEVIDTTDQDGRRTTFSYNSDGDLTGETWLTSSGGALDTITYSYNADNQLTGASDNYATLTFSYDSGGNQLTAATSGPGSGQPNVTLTSGYNAQNMRTSLSDNLSNQGTVSFTYDPAARLTLITTTYGGTAGPQVAYTYDPGGRITYESRTIGGSGTAVATSYLYDAANRETTILVDKVVPNPSGGGSTTTPLATYVYGYDQANRVTTMVDAEGTYTYTYDKANELTAVEENGSQVESYSYDLNGNRNSTGYATGTENETTAAPGYTFTYDNAGNTISETNTNTHVTTTFAYDYRNRLTGVTQGGTVIATYTYDALNRRIGIDENSTQTWTVYDGTNPYADFNGSGTLSERYLFGPGVVNGDVVDEILARTSSGGSTAWYLQDKLGSVRDIVSSSASELDHIVYDSFGNIVTETDAANGDRFKYAGMEYDAAAGIYYDRARYYDQVTGRFVSQDPTGFRAGDQDLYRYVGNDPACAVDPSGLSGEGQGNQGQQGPGGSWENMEHYAWEWEAALIQSTYKQRMAQARAQRLNLLKQQDNLRRNIATMKREAKAQKKDMSDAIQKLQAEMYENSMMIRSLRKAEQQYAAYLQSLWNWWRIENIYRNLWLRDQKWSVDPRSYIQVPKVMIT